MPGTTIMGMIYVYLPFTLFPIVLGLSMVPRDQVDSAGDLTQDMESTVALELECHRSAVLPPQTRSSAIVELALEDARRLTGRDTRAEAQARRHLHGLTRIHPVVYGGADRAIRPEEHPAQSSGQDDRRRTETKIATQPVKDIARA